MADDINIKAKLTVEDGNLKQTTANAKKAGEALDKTARGAQQTDRALKGAAGASSNNTKNFSKMAQGITGGLVPAYATLAANVFAVSAAFNFFKSAGDLEVLKQGQIAYAASTGVAMRTLAQDIISATDSQLDFTEASQAGAIGVAAGLNSEQIVRLGKAAKEVSSILGRDLTDSFNRLVRGITKAEPELLDELGIILRLEEATRNYQRTLGIGNRPLSIQQKQQAVYAEVIGQVEDKYSKILEILGPTSNEFDKLGKSVNRLIEGLKSLLAKYLSPLASWFAEKPELFVAAMLPLITSVTKALIPGLDSAAARLKVFGANLVDTTKKAEAAAAAISSIGASQAKSNIQNILSGMTLSGSSVLGKLQGGQEVSGKALGNLISQMEMLESTTTNKSKNISTALRDMYENERDSYNQLRLNAYSLQAQIAKTSEAKEKARQSGQKFAQGLKGVSIASNIASVSIRALSIVMTALNYAFTAIAIGTWIYSMYSAYKASKDLEEKNIELSRTFEEEADRLKNLTEEYSKFNRVQNEITKDGGGALQSLASFGERARSVTRDLRDDDWVADFTKGLAEIRSSVTATTNTIVREAKEWSFKETVGAAIESVDIMLRDFIPDFFYKGFLPDVKQEEAEVFALTGSIGRMSKAFGEGTIDLSKFGEEQKNLMETLFLQINQFSDISEGYHQLSRNTGIVIPGLEAFDNALLSITQRDLSKAFSLTAADFAPLIEAYRVLESTGDASRTLLASLDQASKSADEANQNLFTPATRSQQILEDYNTALGGIADEMERLQGSDEDSRTIQLLKERQAYFNNEVEKIKPIIDAERTKGLLLQDSNLKYQEALVTAGQFGQQLAQNEKQTRDLNAEIEDLTTRIEVQKTIVDDATGTTKENASALLDLLRNQLATEEARAKVLERQKRDIEYTKRLQEISTEKALEVSANAVVYNRALINATAYEKSLADISQKRSNSMAEIVGLDKLILEDTLEKARAGEEDIKNLEQTIALNKDKKAIQEVLLDLYKEEEEILKVNEGLRLAGLAAQRRQFALQTAEIIATRGVYSGLSERLSREFEISNLLEQQRQKRLEINTYENSSLADKEEKIIMAQSELNFLKAQTDELQRQTIFIERMKDAYNQGLGSNLEAELGKILKGEESSFSDAALSIVKGTVNSLADEAAKTMATSIMTKIGFKPQAEKLKEAIAEGGAEAAEKIGEGITDSSNDMSTQLSASGTDIANKFETAGKTVADAIAAACANCSCSDTGNSDITSALGVMAGADAISQALSSFKLSEIKLPEIKWPSISSSSSKSRGTIITLETPGGTVLNRWDTPGGRYGGMFEGYATGGVARGREAGYPAILHGTEAIVPLPNGNSIPVEMLDSANNTNTNVVVNVNIEGNGNTTSEQIGDNASGIGNLLAIAVQKELHTQLRPGGILSRSRR